MADMHVSFAGVDFKNPVTVASGTFAFGREYAEYYDLSRLGGICVKGLTPEARGGNPSPRIAETPMGILNSVGLQNPGVDAFIREELPFLRGFDTKIIANISAPTPEDYALMAAKLADAGVDMIEINVSCPNVRAGGMAFGVTCEGAAGVTAAVKKAARGVPVMTKLSPNVTDIAEIARACEDAGADALSLINTLLGMKIDPVTGVPILANNTGGLSGPAVFPVAVRMVWQVSSAVKIPVMGMGGVSKAEDAAEMIWAGASLVSVGTATLADPFAPIKVLEGLEMFLDEQSLTLEGMKGRVKLH